MKKTIITGGSSGLGFEIAKQLVESGKEVVLIGRSYEKLDIAKNRFGPLMASVEIFSCDISNENEVLKFREFIVSKSYIVEYLFNVAGEGFYGPIEKVSQTDIKKVFDANLTGLILMCKTFVPIMDLDPDGGRVVNVLSTAALKGKKMESIYYAAKWGARGFTESLKDEVQDTAIEIMTVYPGGMLTPFWDNSTSGYPTHNFMNAADVAKVIADICLNRNVYISEITIGRPKKK